MVRTKANNKRGSKESNGFETKISEVQDGIYRLSTYHKEFGITFNQFLIKDTKSALIHTGPAGMFDGIERRVKEVVDPDKLDYVLLLHFEADEWGGMRFADSPRARLVSSRVSSAINLAWWHDLPKKHIGVWEGDSISLGKKRLRFLMTPHVHHWDSMMVFEETQKALFPSDLFLQRGDNTPVANDPKLVETMLFQYRNVGIFADEKPVRKILPKLERLSPKLIHAMHGSSLDSSVHSEFFGALRTQDFAYTNSLLFEKVPNR